MAALQRLLARSGDRGMIIQALIETNPNLDRERIERWVGEFARALDMPDLWEDIAFWLRDT